MTPTWEGMVAVHGLLDPEAGQTLTAALDPLARPGDGHDDRSGDQRRADALVELARRNLEHGQLPHSGGIRPPLLVTIDLDSLLDHPGALGGDTGPTGPLSPKACRRLACDSAVTRVLITRHPSGHPGHHLVSWLDGGPTDLDNLALLCRAHHRAIHDGGWQLIRGPDGQFTATPPHHRRHRTAAWGWPHGEHPHRARRGDGSDSTVPGVCMGPTRSIR